MDIFSDTVLLSRLQFAFTAMFHILWPVLTIGLAWFLVVVEVLWLRSGDRDYYLHARFWSKILLLNFTIGVVSGIPLEFEFGTNWAPFSRLSGDFFGNILGFEGAMAFMLEAGFVGIMLYGWRRVSPAAHLFSTTMVAFGATLSAVWVMAANGWMQSPMGGHLQGGNFIVDDYLAAIFNRETFMGMAHMWLACLETSLFVIGGISAAYLLRRRHSEFFLKSLKLAMLGALLIAPLQILVGDGSGQTVFSLQPAKGAAMEGLWQTNAAGTGADWAVLAWPDKDRQDNRWSLSIPDALSLLVTHSLHGRVAGLRDYPPADQPPAIPLIFYAFRLMVAVGVWFFILAGWSAWTWWRGRLTVDGIDMQRRLLYAWLASIPLGYLAVECGWIVREVGRQPWLIYGVLRTHEAASSLPGATVLSSLLMFILIYGVLLLSFLLFLARILRRGPALTQGHARGDVR